MDDADTLQVIIKNRTLYDNIINCSVDKLFYNVAKRVTYDQIKKLYFFKRFKKRTVFPKKIKPRGTYYTLKNTYINREEEPILFF
tara:strand:- start:7281 stop:7535 length:255 start_codon:yes stop_codon:yes gene_type:complete